jgi:hypothetical protein
MPFLPHFGSIANLRFSPPEGLPRSALRAGDNYFPYGGVGIVDRQKLKPSGPVFGHRSPAEDCVTQARCDEVPASRHCQARCLLPSLQGVIHCGPLPQQTSQRLRNCRSDGTLGILARFWKPRSLRQVYALRGRVATRVPGGICAVPRSAGRRRYAGFGVHLAPMEVTDGCDGVQRSWLRSLSGSGSLA